MQTIYLLPVWDTISTAWEKVRGAKKSFWAALILLMFIMFGAGFIAGLLEEIVPGLKSTLNLIAQLINFLLQMGVLYLGIRRAQDLPISYRDMFHAFKFDIAIRLIGVNLLQIAIFILPAILVVISGITSSIFLSIILFMIATIAVFYLSIRMLFAVGNVLDKGTNSWTAIKTSFQQTQGNFWPLLGLFFVQLFILAVSIIPVGLGLIWTLPLLYIVYGVAYKKLLLNIKS